MLVTDPKVTYGDRHKKIFIAVRFRTWTQLLVTISDYLSMMTWKVWSDSYFTYATHTIHLRTFYSTNLRHLRGRCLDASLWGISMFIIIPFFSSCYSLSFCVSINILSTLRKKKIHASVCVLTLTTIDTGYHRIINVGRTLMPTDEKCSSCP